MVQLWMVDRTYDDKGMVRVTYATTDGERTFQREFAEQQLYRKGHSVTAAVHVEEDRVHETPADEKAQFAAEASRMAETHDPDDAI